MVNESTVMKHKCKLCKGTVCIHTHLANAERKKEDMSLPSMADQGMKILDKLLKENSQKKYLSLALGKNCWGCPPFLLWQPWATWKACADSCKWNRTLSESGITAERRHCC
ncbi:hypothetical protein ScPMuIL_001006 [Solemya velum]